VTWSPPPFAGLVLDEAARCGVAAADLLIKEARIREATFPAVRTGESMERGIALRVFLPDGRAALGALTLREAMETGRAGGDRLLSLVRRTVASAALSSPGPLPGLPGGEAPEGRGLGLFDPDLESATPSLLESASEIHQVITESMGRVDADLRLQGVVAAVSLCNTAGFCGSFRQTTARLDLTLAARRNGHSGATRVVRASRSLRGLSPDVAAREAAELLEERLDPRIPPSGIHTVLMTPRAAGEIVAALSGWLSRGRWGEEEEGGAGGAPRQRERVASHGITFTDDGRLPGGVASAPFDGEGTATGRILLVERGVVREILRDLESGAGGSGSTGNGIRVSFREPPRLGPTNLFIHPGSAQPPDLLASVRQGIRISALGRIPPLRDPDTPFAVPFTGRWIQNGKLETPLGGGYLAGTLREILTEVETAGSDFTFTHRHGSFGAPSLLVRRAPIRSS
jgi:PmbA protein